jgi:hypothetical protein
MRYLFAFVLFAVLCQCSTQSGNKQKPLKVLAFFTAEEDKAHITFVHEANKWFAHRASSAGFRYDSTNNWSDLNSEKINDYDLLVFLDTRPEAPEQRAAFEKYMKDGGAWMGFHFAAFALTPSDFPQNWDWYHNEFLGAGQYKSNTWRPTSATVRVVDTTFAFTQSLPDTFSMAPNEWYRWEGDLTTMNDIRIIYAIDSTSFPLGTGPKPHEIWHEGYYPVVWSNSRYNMIYFNMGHNDMDYGGTDAQLSSTFSSEKQNTLIEESLKYFAARSQAARKR